MTSMCFILFLNPVLTIPIERSWFLGLLVGKFDLSAGAQYDFSGEGRDSRFEIQDFYNTRVMINPKNQGYLSTSRSHMLLLISRYYQYICTLMSR